MHPPERVPCDREVHNEKTKYAVLSIMGYVKGKPFLRLFQRYEQIGKRYWGRHLWARGYCASTVGLNVKMIRTYVQWQEKKEKDIEKQQLSIS